MRRAYQSNDIYFTDDGTAIAAIALGFDFCAEHEWGVKRLREHLGMLPTKEYSRDNAGEQRNRIGVSKINKNMIHRGTLENGDAYVLFFYNRDNREITEEHVNRLIGNIYDGQKLATAWDERSFGIRVPSETGPLLNEFFDKIFEGKGYLFLGGSNNPFSNPSLTLAVEDVVDDHIKKMWYDIDIDYYDLKDASKKSELNQKSTRLIENG